MSALNRDASSLLNPAAPLAIGGLGGSGTRIVAEILIQAGYFLGPELNLENDNLWFTVLLKRPRWFQKVASRKDTRIFTALRILTKAMLGLGSLNLRERFFLNQAAKQMSITGHDAAKTGSGAWPFERAQNIKLAAKTPLKKSYRGWGWKEPNSHIYLPHLIWHFAELRYVHVVRHGLDLAFSNNQQQLHNWSFLYDVAILDSKAQQPAAALKYWVRANQRAFELGKKMGAERFFCLNYDRLCGEPESQVAPMLALAGLHPSPEEFARLCALPEKQKTSERYLRNDCSVFDPADVEAVREFGFEVKI